MNYGLSLVTSPSAYPVTLAEAKDYLRVTASDEDTLITSLIATATEYAENFTGRKFITQSWALTYDEFPSDEICLPFTPVQSITHIKYKDENGVLQTWASSKYQSDLTGIIPKIKPVYTETFPSTFNTVTVTFVAGYDYDETVSPVDLAENVPQGIKQAILYLVSQFYDNRIPYSFNGSVTSMPMTFTNLLMPFRVWRL